MEKRPQGCTVGLIKISFNLSVHRRIDAGIFVTVQIKGGKIQNILNFLSRNGIYCLHAVHLYRRVAFCIRTVSQLVEITQCIAVLFAGNDGDKQDETEKNRLSFFHCW